MTVIYQGHTTTEANANLDAIVAAAAALTTAAVTYPVLAGEAGVTVPTQPRGNPLRYGGSGLGTFDDRAALLAADTAAANNATIGYTVIPPGTWRIASTLVFTKPVLLLPGALLKRDAGVVVTFAAAVYAGTHQCFDATDLTGRFLFTAGTLPSVRAEWWGAKADNTTDSTAAIQAAIDATIYGGARCRMEPLGGRYKTTDTLHLGYGDSFRSVVIEGQGYAYDSSGGFNGSSINPTQTDRPTINFQGARGSVLRSIGLFGKLDTYLIAHSFCAVGGAQAGFDDTLLASWDDPGLGGASLDTQYAPYAAVTVDAYAGVQPGTSYPAVTYPGWSGIVAQYGKAPSSDVLCEDVHIQGYTAAVAVQPSNTDSNGDYTALRRVDISACKYGVSVGNTQSRNVDLTDVKMTRVHTMLTDNKHGHQQGKFGGAITNLSSGGAIQVCDLGSAYPGPVVFTNLYAEALWRIGLIGAAGASNNAFLFMGALLDFGAQNDVRGYPAFMLAAAETGGGASPTDVQFRGCTMLNYKSVVTLGHDGVSLDGVYCLPASMRANPYEQFAHNATAGGFIGVNLKTPRGRSRIRFTQFNVDTAAVNATLMTDKVIGGARPFTMSWYAESAGALNEVYDEMGRPPVRTEALDKSAFSSSTLVSGVLTITFTARTASQFLQIGGLPGDILFDRSSGSVFFIRSRVGTTIIAELQNNYKLVGAVKTPINAYTPLVGTMDVRNSRVYTPTWYLRGDLTAASNVLTNVGRDDGYAVFIDTDLAVGDALVVQDTRDSFLPLTGADITARTSAGPTITVSAAVPAGRTQVRRRLDWFARLGPANV